MGTLYRPTIIEYRLADGSAHAPDGRRVTKNTPGAVRHKRKADAWYGRYRDATGKPCQRKLSTSKETARRMLRALEGKGELASAGIEDPFEEHRNRPLAEHLEDFRRFLSGKNNVQTHIQKTCSQCQAILAGCGFAFLADIQPSAIVEYLAGLRAERKIALPSRRETFTLGEIAELLGVTPESVRRTERRGLLAAGEGRGLLREYPREAVQELVQQQRRGISIQTSNHYLVAFKSFLKWMVKERRTPFDPLAHLSELNAEVDSRHQRRALSAGEFSRFLDATAAGQTFRGLSGTDRIVLYCTAARTGLRASELASLTPASFALEASPATVTVEAAYSKHREEDVLPLRADLVQMLRQFLQGKPRRQPVWPGSWPAVGAEMIRRDLEAAGIPYRDEDGAVMDFHGLRHTFLTHLAESGVHPKVAQILARHSTITLTMDRYTHLRALDVADDLNRLPPLPAVAGQREPAVPPMENPGEEVA